MGQRDGGTFEYQSWCEECSKVTVHVMGDCLRCIPAGFPRPAFVSKDVLTPVRVPGRKGRAA